MMECLWVWFPLKLKPTGRFFSLMEVEEQISGKIMFQECDEEKGFSNFINSNGPI